MELPDHKDASQPDDFEKSHRAAATAIRLAARSAQIFRWAVWIVAGSAYLTLIVPAWVDRSWTAFGIAIFVSPSVNAVLLICQVGCAFMLHRKQTMIGLSELLPSAIFAPIASMIATTATIMMMDLHGC